MSIYVLYAAVASYLIGSIPFGFILARYAKGIDIRQFGSGNIGATNVWRTLGPVPGIIVLLLDMSKGVASVFIGRHLGGAGTELIAAFFALCGHSWPVFIKFKGGKIVATGGGIILAISPLTTLIALIVLLITVGISRYVSLGSIMAAITVPVTMIILRMNILYILFGVVIAAFVIYKHRPNIKRILDGTEFKVGKGRR
ncbi:acyl-phosphate glycerol-3-phosphate acyltransferase [Desulfotomaculum arcticum]|uniref:Glycerol-3-phosphate acyltransferase n=1 Tax=Desulfotruncus arcticus DSM 17038 TaxID=1121424 RepID=A0A1I2MVN5_9FIRM|nr:glycerol-3-phosphate 1-O-acyltransferase PlsY [Desulfotruncus arcticus]SFF94960.1 acyl-phosphate glycerol-3-phosphate acyltransferase [Desulfotomaculum arcticum] [Desulfotruncus arcticus DSM 17038]